jgi:ankyrin repeat protein
MSDNNEIDLPPDVHIVNTNDIEPIVVKAVTKVCSHQDMDVSAALFHTFIQNLCSSSTSSDTDNIEHLVNERDLQPSSERSSSSGGLGAIHFAAQYGNHKIISILLDAGANPNLIKNNGCTALHTVIFAAGYDQFRKGRSIDDYLKCIDILMKHKKFELPRHDRHDDDKIAVSFGNTYF